MSESRNLGLRHVRGELIAFLDADDVFLPQKLERQLSMLEKHPDAAMVYGATEYWHSWQSNPKREDHTWRRFGVPTNSIIPPPQLLLTYLDDPNTLPCNCGALIRTSAIQQVGGFEPTFRGLYEDQVFFAKLAANHPILVSDECHARYRRHSGSACGRADPIEVQRAYRSYLEWLRRYTIQNGLNSGPIRGALSRELWLTRFLWMGRLRNGVRRLLRKVRRRREQRAAMQGRHLRVGRWSAAASASRRLPELGRPGGQRPPERIGRRLG
jgi:glycosyltransferase involved in cell wall biosynthesis